VVSNYNTCAYVGAITDDDKSTIEIINLNEKLVIGKIDLPTVCTSGILLYRALRLLSIDCTPVRLIFLWSTLQEVWDAALATTWSHPPVWVHGDISVGNLLVKDGQLSAVIDFGQVK